MSDDPAEEEEAGPPLEIANAADERSLKRSRNTARQREREARAFWTGVFASEVGRREMWGILASGHAFDERFVSGPNGFPQPEATWCQAGEQRLAFRLYLSWLALDAEGVGLMLRENEPGLAATHRASRRSR